MNYNLKRVVVVTLSLKSLCWHHTISWWFDWNQLEIKSSHMTVLDFTVKYSIILFW